MFVVDVIVAATFRDALRQVAR